MVLRTTFVLCLTFTLLTSGTDAFLKIGRKRSTLDDKTVSRDRLNRIYQDEAKRGTGLAYLKDLVHDINVLKELKAVVESSDVSSRTVRDILYDAMEKTKKEKAV